MKKEKQLTTSSPQIKKPKAKGLNYLVFGILSCVLSAACFIGYFMTNNMMFGYAFLVPGALGYFLIHKYTKAKDKITETIYSKTPIPSVQVNSMNIYPANQGGVKFEDVDSPDGQPWICDNDSKPYFIHIWDDKIKKLTEFKLPDEQYYDPRIFAERVLGLPAHRRIFIRKQNIVQKLSPFMLLVLIVILWIVIVTTGPTPELQAFNLPMFGV